MSVRTFTCGDCQRTLAAPGARGRLPKYCESCRPNLALTAQRERNRRLELTRLRDQVASLQAELAAVGADDARARRVGPPSRATVALAVRRVGQAEGRTATADALLDLAAVARSWASVLATHEPRDSEFVRRHAA